MTVLFQSDFESFNTGDAVPGWVAVTGYGIGACALKYADFSKTPIAGAVGFGRQNVSDCAIYTTAGALGNQAIAGVTNLSCIGESFVLRSDTAGANQYRFLLGVDGTGKLTASITRFQGGTTILQSVTTGITPQQSDLIRYEAYAIGSTLSMYVWINGTAKPSSATVSVPNDTTLATGYPGVIQTGTASVFSIVDNLVVTDGAGGESTFYPAGSNPAPTFSGTIANITGTGGTAITPVDVHALFSDTDTLTYSASPAGTAWPSGLVINSSTGVISGTVASAVTVTGLKVRATDTASQTVDSNAFNVTISAGAVTVTSVSVSPSSSTVVGGANQTFTATVTGANSPAQTVTWSASAGSITSGGVFTAPAATSSAQTITITATSTVDTSKSGTATVTVPATSTSTSYVDVGTEPCDNEQSGLLPAGTVLNAVVFRRDDLTVAKQVVTGITVGTGSVVPRFQVALAVGTPIHVVFIQASDPTQTGVVSNFATVS